MNGNTCASSVAGCAGQWHLRGPDSVPHKLPFSQEARGRRGRGGGAGACRGCGDAFCHAGTRARIFTCERINANSPDSPQTLLTFEGVHFIAVGSLIIVDSVWMGKVTVRFYHCLTFVTVDFQLKISTDHYDCRVFCECHDQVLNCIVMFFVFS